jgi:serine phosphatase RsbU (regulator of sigma subunit)
LTEVRNAAGEEFGEERLIGIVEQRARGSLADLQRALIDTVRGFGLQDDDQTVLVLRPKPSPPA